MRYFLIFFSCCLLTAQANAQKKCNKQMISIKQFDSLVQKYINTISIDKIDTTMAFELARIYNTIEWENMSNEECKTFIAIYNKQYYYDVISLLEAKRWKGGSYYSKKFNITIGGVPQENSRYFITK